MKDALQLKDMENAKQLTALKNAFSAKYQDLQKNGQYLSQGEVVARQQELATIRKKLCEYRAAINSSFTRGEL